MDISQIKEQVEKLDRPFIVPDLALEQRMVSDALQAVRTGIQQSLDKNDLKSAQQILNIAIASSKLSTKQAIDTLQQDIFKAQRRQTNPDIKYNQPQPSRATDNFDQSPSLPPPASRQSFQWGQALMMILLTIIFIALIIGFAWIRGFVNIVDPNNDGLSSAESTQVAEAVLATVEVIPPQVVTTVETVVETVVVIATPIPPTIETETPKDVVSVETVTPTPTLEPITITVIKAPDVGNDNPITFVYALTWSAAEPLARIEIDQPETAQQNRISLMLAGKPADEYFRLDENNAIWPVKGRLISDLLSYLQIPTENDQITLDITLDGVVDQQLPLKFIDALPARTTSNNGIKFRPLGDEGCERDASAVPHQDTLVDILGTIIFYNSQEQPRPGFLLRLSNENGEVYYLCQDIDSFERNILIGLPNLQLPDFNILGIPLS